MKKLVASLLASLFFIGNAYGEKTQASTQEKPLNIINLYELASEASKNMDKGASGYIRGGAEDELVLENNKRSFNQKFILPRVMQNIETSDIDLSTQLFGIPLKTPIIQSPMAAQGLAHQDGELASAKGMAKAGSIFSLSTYSNKTIEEVAKVAGENPFFFQFYLNKNTEFNAFILNYAKQNGAKAIILTVDSTVAGYREDDVRNNFNYPGKFANVEAFEKYLRGKQQLTPSEVLVEAKQALVFSDIQYVKQLSGLPVIVKGIQSPVDAHHAIKAGADAIWVSNHGGRQLDSGPASFDMLPAIAKMVNKRVPIIFDSGVRRGSHVFKALASGADIVAVGRPILYGLHLGGAEGVNSVIEHLNKELRINMQLGGVKDIEQIQRTVLYTQTELETRFLQ
nr:alpha-hydroxy-acid oxidizing protein [Providencia stuartii]ELR5084155.1 alpha-hydroxy-acid oxidizing protein [Providencia stuartii]